ncbi:UvrD-helicase domain-containing protein [Nodularia sp. NIES-3585]|uniref:UvrD-helicase domain-containing protein n=1 Tax=Nodularia sp. NIES-3585 TaxID=1973477 RepID=UPI000B5CDE3A|nr:UvrD-helicase domain-containing protein [Nodularia sp. NIES-3585]GAX37606.1 UvrD/REP helicase [Nodularia sp. NIES-3585]
MYQLSLFAPQPIDNAREWRKKFKFEFPWNKYQLNLFEEAERGISNIAVEAVAGSGKTSSIRGLIAALPTKSKIAVMAFNRHIADKLKNDPVIPRNRVRINTAHGFGYSLLRRFFQGYSLNLVENKYYQIAKEQATKIINLRSHYDYDQNLLPPDTVESDWICLPPFFNESDPQGRAEVKQFIRFIREVAQYAMKTLTPLNLDDLWRMIQYFAIEYPASENAIIWGIKGAIEAIDIGEQQARDTGRISYEEMLYLPCRWKLEPAKKDWIIIDEAQDASPAQIALYKSYVDQGAKIIYIGDRRQAIQGFAGSDAYSWQNLETTFKPKSLPLSVCYRCPSSHLLLARCIVSQIEAAPGADKGEVKIIAYDVLLNSVKPGELIICRLTEPLIKTCLKLIAAGTQATIRGRKIGENLTSLATKALGGVNWPSSFSINLHKYLAPQMQHLLEEGLEQEAELLNDRWESLTYLFKEFGAQCPTFEMFCQKIESLFSDTDTKGLAILSTIHRAKGDEADVVWLLGSNLLPFTYKCTQAWQEEQEINLTYVALTRAKKSLHLVPYSNQLSKQELDRLLFHPLGGLRLPEGNAVGKNASEIS